MLVINTAWCWAEVCTDRWCFLPGFPASGLSCSFFLCALLSIELNVPVSRFEIKLFKRRLIGNVLKFAWFQCKRAMRCSTHGIEGLARPRHRKAPLTSSPCHFSWCAIQCACLFSSWCILFTKLVSPWSMPTTALPTSAPLSLTCFLIWLHASTDADAGGNPPSPQKNWTVSSLWIWFIISQCFLLEMMATL